MAGIFKEVFRINKRTILFHKLNSLNINHFNNFSSANGTCYDVVVVGGGIVGTASARELLLRNSSLRMAVVEKESKLAAHQSGHNSGVVHAGIYYKPGSLKAKLCVEGMYLAYDYFDAKNIPYKKVGKLIVATDAAEVRGLRDLYKRGLQNGVADLRLLKGEKEIREVEPHCKGVEALWSPHTGIVDWALVTEQYAEDFKCCGGEVHLGFEVVAFEPSAESGHPVLVRSRDGRSMAAKHVLTCGGLQSDKLAELSGCPRDPRIVPFRGEYLLLSAEKCKMVKGNIYPVPDPRFPFLGVHFTPRMDGSVWLGPNAVLALKREGYTWFDVNVLEMLDAVSYPGFQRLAFKHVGYGLQETFKSVFFHLQVKQLQRYIPEVTRADVRRGPAGVRAQALDRDGTLVDDFRFDSGEGPVASMVLHCRNAPSPGATSSLAIAKMMADKMREQFGLR